MQRLPQLMRGNTSDSYESPPPFPIPWIMGTASAKHHNPNPWPVYICSRIRRQGADRRKRPEQTTPLPRPAECSRARHSGCWNSAALVRRIGLSAPRQPCFGEPSHGAADGSELALARGALRRDTLSSGLFSGVANPAASAFRHQLASRLIGSSTTKALGKSAARSPPRLRRRLLAEPPSGGLSGICRPPSSSMSV